MYTYNSGAGMIDKRRNYSNQSPVALRTNGCSLLPSLFYLHPSLLYFHKKEPLKQNAKKPSHNTSVQILPLLFGRCPPKFKIISLQIMKDNGSSSYKSILKEWGNQNACLEENNLNCSIRWYPNSHLL